MSTRNKHIYTSRLALLFALAGAGCGDETFTEDESLGQETLNAPFPRDQGTGTDYIPQLDTIPRVSPVSSTSTFSTTQDLGTQSPPPPDPTTTETQETQGPTSTQSSSAPSSSDTASNDASTGSPSPDDSTDSTNVDNTSSTPTETDSTASTDATHTGDTTSSEQTHGPTQGAPLPNIGPVDALVTRLTLPGTPLRSPSLRAMIFETELLPRGPASPEPNLGYVAQANYNWSPRVSFDEFGQSTLVVPNPPQDQLITRFTGTLDEQGRAYESSALLGLAVYDDLNDNGSWDSTREPFIAALAGTMVHLAATEDAPAQWRWVDTRRVRLFESSDIKLKSSPIGNALALERLDGRGPAPTLKGRISDVDPRASYLTLVTDNERLALHQFFAPRERGADLPLRDTDTKAWRFTAPKAPTWLSHELPFVRLPGIKSIYTLTHWVVGYARPIGVPIPYPGQYLTPKSTLIGGVCAASAGGPSEAVAAVWLRPGPFASSPIGAFYAAHAGLGSGWGFVLVNAKAPAPYPLVGTRSNLNMKIASSGEGCGLQLPTPGAP